MASVSAFGQIKVDGVVYGTMKERCGIADKMIRDSHSNIITYKGSRLYWFTLTTGHPVYRMSVLNTGSKSENTGHMLKGGIAAIDDHNGVITEKGSRLTRSYLINFLRNIYTLLFFPSDILTI